MTVRFLSGWHPDQGRIYAAIDESARFTSPEVRPSRLGSLLAPYPSVEAAEAALREAGAEVDREIRG